MRTPDPTTQPLSAALDQIIAAAEAAKVAERQLDLAEHLEMPEIFGDLGLGDQTAQETVNVARMRVTEPLRDIVRLASSHLAEHADALEEGGATKRQILAATGIPASTIIRRRRAREARDDTQD